MYVAHPSLELSALFAKRPYQGVSPDQSTFLFVGQDANYDAQIDQGPFFSRVREYHSDGIEFWRRNGVHHPFLLPEYSGDGQRYHRNFSRIGFESKHADLVSFIELLHVPTVGRSVLVAPDLDMYHLRMLNTVILEGKAEHIFVPAGVARLMRASKEFPWIARSPSNGPGGLGVLFSSSTKTVYSHLHFAVYGKFEKRRIQEAFAIRALLPKDR